MARIPGSWTFLASSIVLTIVLIYGLRKRNTPLGRVFILLISCALLWTVAFLFELRTPTLAMKLLFARIQFIGIALIPFAWLQLSLLLSGRRMPRMFWLLSWSLSGIVLAFIWFVPTPNLFWANPSLVPVRELFLTVDYDYGPLFTMVLMPLVNIMILSSLGLLVHLLVQPHPMYRRQTLLIIVGTLIPLMVNLLYIFGITPVPHLNYSTSTLSITGVLTGYALFKYRYLELYPLARDIIFEQMHDAVFVFNARGTVIDANQAARQIVGVGKDSVGVGYRDIQAFQNTLPILEGMFEGNVSRSVTPQEIGGRLFDISVSSVADKQGQGRCAFCILHDVTEREELYKRIEELGTRDPLTGAYNRGRLISTIDEKYHEACASKLPLSLAMLDIDSFKQINDTYGHEAGDRALETFAKLMFRCIQPTDIIGRYGGDEFVIISIAADETEIVALAEHIREQVSSRVVQTHTGSFSIRVSIGVKTFRFTDATVLPDPATKLLSEVDTALYVAKRAGKDRISSG